MADVLVGRAPLDEVVRPTETEGIDVAPAHIDLAATEGELFTMLGRESLLRDAMEETLANRYDYALIDCPPNLGLLTVNGLVAADGVIISTSDRPARTASSTTYWMAGRSTTGSISFGVALVAGRKRVPRPAAGITALTTAGPGAPSPRGSRSAEMLGSVMVKTYPGREGIGAL